MFLVAQQISCDGGPMLLICRVLVFKRDPRNGYGDFGDRFWWVLLQMQRLSHPGVFLLIPGPNSS